MLSVVTVDSEQMHSKCWHEFLEPSKWSSSFFRKSSFTFYEKGILQPPKFGDEGFGFATKFQQETLRGKTLLDRVIIPLKTHRKKTSVSPSEADSLSAIASDWPWLGWLESWANALPLCIAVFHGFLNRFLGIPFEAENSSISWFPASALCINISQKNVFLHLQPVT